VKKKAKPQLNSGKAKGLLLGTRKDF